MTVERIERTERFDRVLLFIAQRGGRYQRNLAAFADEVGIPLSTFRKILNRAVELKLLEVTRTSHPTIGAGRLPNAYALRIGYAEWIARREQILADADARKEAAKAGKARNAVQARRDAAAPLDPVLTRPEPSAGHTAPQPFRPVTTIEHDYRAPLSDIDVDAWALDFEV